MSFSDSFVGREKDACPFLSLFSVSDRTRTRSKQPRLVENILQGIYRDIIDDNLIVKVRTCG